MLPGLTIIHQGLTAALDRLAEDRKGVIQGGMSSVIGNTPEDLVALLFLQEVFYQRTVTKTGGAHLERLAKDTIIVLPLV